MSMRNKLGASGRASPRVPPLDLSAVLCDSTPQPVGGPGSGNPGTSNDVSRCDHVHAFDATILLTQLSRELWVDGGTTVAPAGQDGNIETPFATIQDAIDEAQSVDPTTAWAIDVVPGTYTEVVTVPAGMQISFLGQGTRDQSAQIGAFNIGGGGALVQIFGMSIGAAVLSPGGGGSELFLDNGAVDSVSDDGSGSGVLKLKNDSIINGAGAVNLPTGSVILIDSTANNITAGSLYSVDSGTGAVSLDGTLLTAIDSDISGNVVFTGAAGTCDFDGVTHYRFAAGAFTVTNGAIVAIEFHATASEYGVVTLGGATGVASPFKAQYYVDSSFAGVQLGSASNPFTTIAAAFTYAAVTLGLPGATIILPDGGSIVGNVTFPSVGGDWEIRSAGQGRCAIIGTVTATSVPQSFFRLTNIVVTGAVSGDATAAGGNFLYCTNTLLSTTTTLTGTGAGFWWVLFQGNADTQFEFGGGSSGVSSIAGALMVDKWYFGAAVTTWTFTASNSRLPASLTLNGSSRAVVLQDCILQGGSMTITGSGGTATVSIDGYTMTEALNRGLTLTSATLKTFNANYSSTQTLAGNLIATTLSGGVSTIKAAAGIYRMTATLNLIAAGTTGTLVVNAIYTNLAGVSQTVPITTGLNITAAVGTETAGFIDFWHNGSIGLQFSVTGSVTPGALSYQVAVVAQKLD